MKLIGFLLPKKAKHPPKNTSLKWVLLVPFFSQIFALAGAISVWSFLNSQKTVNNIASQLLAEISSRVESEIIDYLADINLIIQLNAEAIKFREVEANNSEAITKYFWRQIKQIPGITYISWGSEEGSYCVERLIDGTLRYLISYASNGYKDYSYRIQKDGTRGEIISPRGIYDPRISNWYKKAFLHKKQVWSDIYAEVVTRKRTITSSYPIFTQEGKLRGVIGVAIAFDELNKFLQTIKVGQTGQIFIVDQSGEIITASVNGEKYVIYKDLKNKKKFQMGTSDNPLVKATGEFILNEFNNDLTRIRESRQLVFQIDKQKQLIQLTPISDEYGLNWLIIVVVPESDFMEQINANARTTIILSLGALALAAIIGLLTAKWIITPILKVINAAESLANGNWTDKIFLKRSDELGKLGEAFNSMATQLQSSFSTLKEKNEELELAKNKLSEHNEDLDKKVKIRTCELSQALEQLKSAQNQILAGEDLRTLGTLVAGVTHELNNPLHAVIFRSDLNVDLTEQLKEVIDGLELNSSVYIQAQEILKLMQENLKLILEGGSRAARIAQTILNQARLKELPSEKVNFNQMVNSSLSMVTYAKQSKYKDFSLQIQTDYDPTIGEVELFAQEINRVVINLIDNACDAAFTKKKKSEIEFQPKVAIKTQKIDNEIQVIVSDNGEGVSESLTETLYQAFVTSKTPGHGTGLGLYMVKKILEKHRGKIWWERVEEQTRFLFKVPILK